MLTSLMNRSAIRAAVAASLVLACQGAIATPITSWNATTDFVGTGSVASNINGVWSYGSTLNLTAGFTAFTSNTTSGPYQYWNGGNLKPSLGKAVGSAYNSTSVHVLANTLNMHPGANGEYSVLRFKALNDGQYTIDADFWNDDSTSTDLHIMADGVQKYSGVIQTSSNIKSASWDGTVTLSAGDFIDFMVGKGSNTWNNDSTGISAVISYTAPAAPQSNVPEPGSLLLLGSGLGLAGMIRRRNRT